MTPTLRMATVALVFPNQLFNDQPVLRSSPQKVLLVEDTLFFGDSQYPARFHKQKLAYHRATMAEYSLWLEGQGHSVEIIHYKSDKSVLPKLCRRLAKEGADTLVVAELNDETLGKRLKSAAIKAMLSLHEVTGPGFLNTSEENHAWRESRKRWFMADFYQWQRKRLDILMDDDKPAGGQWSFDDDNRRKIPNKEIASIPVLEAAVRTSSVDAAVESVESQFPDNPGFLERWIYPTNSYTAEQWLDVFLTERFFRFGPYEDAMVAGQNWLYHSILTPMLNTGLLTPEQVVNKALAAAEKHDVPLNSLEGFIRQIIGWREFMRATYTDIGTSMRTANHWNHTQAIPSSFYDGTTGVDPVDDVILRVLDTGYCHHIERLMVLGGFMFLCEIEPDDIYLWFMEMFIDSYDWVMVPNVYAMSQHADGGSITTKPYFSGSNYVLKMSNYKKGEWSEIWDALFWRWIIKNAKGLAGNPRWAMMVRNSEKMDAQKRDTHLVIAEAYLKKLHG